MARIRLFASLKEVGTTRSALSHWRGPATVLVRSLFWVNGAGLCMPSPPLGTQSGPPLLYDVASSSPAQILLLLIAGFLVVLVLWHILRSVRLVSIRSRLLVSFLLMALVPVGVFGIVSTAVGFQSGRQQVLDRLESVATIKEAELNTWVDNVQGDLVSALVTEQDVEYVRDILSAAPDSAEYRVAYIQLHQRLAQAVARSPRLDGLFLMDLNKRVILSTDVNQEGTLGYPGSNTYLARARQGDYLHPPSYWLTVGGIAAIAVHPVHDLTGETLAVLVGRAGPDRLGEIMLERTGLGATGETYLVTRRHIMLTEPRVPTEQWNSIRFVFTEGANAALQQRVPGQGSYANYRGTRVIGVYHWLPELEVALLAEQAESEALAAVYSTIAINVVVAVIATIAAGMAAFFLSRTMVAPLDELVTVATTIADGDLGRTAKIERHDEIGALAEAFNTMTARLRELIRTLEERVRERTRALRQHAVQLETSAQISREITSILDIDDLLKEVVHVIRTAFDYSSVGVFLVDDETGDLLLAAESTEGSQGLELNGLRLDAASCNPDADTAESSTGVLSDDVLGDGHSELVVPLSVGDRVLGKLVVHARGMGSFTPDHARTMQSLGDQIAIAIENARLYNRSRALAVLEERNRLGRELHDSVTQSLYSATLFAETARRALRSTAHEQAEDQMARLSDTLQQALKQMRLLVHELRPPVLERSGLEGALRQRLDAVETRLAVEASLVVEGALDLSPSVEEGLYRIAQEALNNALRHAEATKVLVAIKADAGQVQLEVVDNGRGFEVSSGAEAGGVGLQSMRERAQSLGGSLDISSEPGEGTCVTVRVFLDQ
jgi:nitrate/nitrite-specific signal transduction histidine kinase